MGDSPASAAGSNKSSPASDEQSDPSKEAQELKTSDGREARHRDGIPQNRRPFGSLEFQVSGVVERLEAGVNGQDVLEDEKRPEIRKVSSGPWMEPVMTSMDDILKMLEDLVMKTDPNVEIMEPPLLPTDAVTRAAILSHSIAALFGRLDRAHAARLGGHIASETTRWMLHMFRLGDYQAYYHHEHLEGLVKVTRMLLHHRYPRYLEDGALALVGRLPCIYSCVASPLNVVQHLCRQLSLPLACVRPVPVHPLGRGMDTEALSRLCEEDEGAGRTPLLVLAEGGAAPLGDGSDLAAVGDVCRARGLYLHLRGHALAVAALRDEDQVFDIADSLTITPSQWFGVPGLPAVTFYRVPESSANDAKGVNAAAGVAGLWRGAARLPAVPLWAAGLAGGAPALTARLRAAFRAARAMRAMLQEHRLRILSAKPGGDEPPNVGIVEAVSRASGCVTFQFAPPTEGKPPPYYDKLNSWLGQVMQRETDTVNIEVCETESHGVVLRYCPLEGSLNDEEHLQAWGVALGAQLHVLHATVGLRGDFQRQVQANPNLRLVNLPSWAGLGGVRYVPAGWEQASREELNALNEKLVDTLRTTDNAFSCGDGDDGMACVRFGMVTADTDVSELLELVAAAGREREASDEALTTMTEVLKKGIEEAQADIERENAERVWQEGVLRRVPVVGRVVQWWAGDGPPPAAGRRLQLAVGTLQTTDDVYRNVQKSKESQPETHTQTETQ